MYLYSKKNAKTNHISAWKSEGQSDEGIRIPSTSDNSLAPALSYIGIKTSVKFDGGCLKQDKIKFTHEKTVNINIVYEKNLWNRGYEDYPTLENSLFGAVRLVKIADIDKYKYSGFGIGYDRHGTFSVANRFGKNVITFRVDMSSSVHFDNTKKDILILGEGPKGGLDDTTLTAEKMYSINFTGSRKKFCLSLHYNGADSY